MKEKERIITGLATIPDGTAGTGTLSQDTNVPTVLIGTGTKFETEIGERPRPFLFFPNTSPPQLLEVDSYNGDEWIKVTEAPGVSISGQSFTIVQGLLSSFSVLNKGAGNGKYDNNSIIPGQTIFEETKYKTGNSGIVPKDAHWVDGTGTTLEVSENP